MTSNNNDLDNNNKVQKNVKKKLYNDAPKYLVPPDDPGLIKKIEEVRELVRKDYEVNSEHYWKGDVDRTLEVDFEVRRFLFQTNLEIEPAVEMIKERFRWRKEMGIENATADRFPTEFYQSAGVFEYKTDIDGDPVLYVRSKFNIKSDVLSTPIRQFLLYNLNLMDQRYDRERCWGVVFDAQGFGWSNIDFDFLHLLIKNFRQFMPWAVKYIIVYEIPWYLESIWKGVQVFIPEDGKRTLRVYNKKTITEQIPLENIPRILGGLSDDEVVKIPEGCRPAEIIGKIELGLEKEDVIKIKKHLEKIMGSDEKVRELTKI